MINDLILLDLSLHLFLFHRLACRMKKYMPISEAWESIYLPMPFLGSLSFDGLLVVSLLALLNNSDVTGLPEPENPTRTGDIFPNPKNTNWKNLKIFKPEIRKIQSLKSEFL